VTQRVSGSEPTNGMPSISRAAGTCASRTARLPFRDVEDDVGRRAAHGVDEPAPAGRRRTSCPAGEGVLYVGDRRLGVVLLEGVLGQMIGVAAGFTLRGEPDSHRRFLLASARPAGMSVRTSPVSSR